MNPSHKQFICFVLFVLPITMHCWVRAEAYDDSWMEPDGWSQGEKCCKCTDLSLVSPPKYEQLETTAETGKFSEDGVALLYLRRWLMLLFDRKKLHDDKRQIKRRTLTFSLSASQLAKIEKWNDVRDLDEVITEVFTKAYENGECYSTIKPTGFLALVRDIFVDFIQLTKISEIRFLLMVILVAICGWFLHRHYHIPYWTLVTGGLLLYGYFHTYLECNRELEVNEMLESIKSAEKQKSSGFMRFMKNLIYGSADPEEQFRKSSKFKLGFCRPDEVAIMYFTNIFLKYLQTLLEQGAGVIDILNSHLSWPFNFVAPILFVALICYFIQLTFKYILRPAVGSYIWHRNSQPHTHHNQNAAIAQGDGNAHATDRISGDNLKTLLGLIKPAVEGNTPKVPAVSGVEEVREAIEPAAPNDTSTSSDTSVRSRSKVNKNSNALKDKVSPYNDVKIEDLPDES